jgi:hypothetical protein
VQETVDSARGSFSQETSLPFLQGALNLSDLLQHCHNQDCIGPSPEVIRFDDQSGIVTDVDDPPLTQALELLSKDFKSAYGIRERGQDLDTLFRKRLAVPPMNLGFKPYFALDVFQSPFFAAS